MESHQLEIGRWFAYREKRGPRYGASEPVSAGLWKRFTAWLRSLFSTPSAAPVPAAVPDDLDDLALEDDDSFDEDDLLLEPDLPDDEDLIGPDADRRARSVIRGLVRGGSRRAWRGRNGVACGSARTVFTRPWSATA